MGDNGLEGLATVEFGRMTSPDMFKWLVQVHAGNLQACLPHIRDGKLYQDGKPVIEGGDEITLPGYKGVLIVANGDTLAARLRADEVIFDDHGGFVKVENAAQLADYLHAQGNPDGGYMYDGVNREIAHIEEYNNSPSSLPKGFDLYRMLPHNFVYDGATEFRGKVGTKTRLAAKLPHAYDHTRAFQIKRTPFADLVGKVTNFGPEGLAEDLHFARRPGLESSLYVLPGIIAVHRVYAPRGDEGVVQIAQNIVTGIEPVPYATISRPSRSPPTIHQGPAQFSLYSAPPSPM